MNYSLNKIHLPFSQFIYNTDQHIEVDILDRILMYHFYPMNQIAHSVTINHIACHRTKKHEISKGRGLGAGRTFWSEHTFEKSERSPDGKGACDVSGPDLELIAALLIQHGGYNRLAIYKDQRFIHADYAWPGRGQRYYDSSWVELDETNFLKQAREA